MIIESLDDWRDYAEILHRMGYSIFQLQYSSKLPEGFRAQFILTGSPDVDIVTHKAEVEEAILKYSSGR